MLSLLAAVGAKPACCPHPLHVLVTGFLPFDHKNDNPAGDSASLLNGKCFPADGGCFVIEGKQVPANTKGARMGSELIDLNSKYSAVIHIGELLDNTMHKIHVETNAANVQGHARSNHLFGAPIFKDSQAILPSTTDFTAIRLDSNDAIWHQDPGSYYCNEQYYRTLHHILTNKIRPRTGETTSNTNRLLPAFFIHLPGSNPYIEIALRTVTSLAKQMVQSVKAPPSSIGSVPASVSVAVPLRILLTGMRSSDSNTALPDRSGLIASILNGTGHMAMTTTRDGIKLSKPYLITSKLLRRGKKDANLVAHELKKNCAAPKYDAILHLHTDEKGSKSRQLASAAKQAKPYLSRWEKLEHDGFYPEQKCNRDHSLSLQLASFRPWTQQPAQSLGHWSWYSLRRAHAQTGDQRQEVLPTTADVRRMDIFGNVSSSVCGRVHWSRDTSAAMATKHIGEMGDPFAAEVSGSTAAGMPAGQSDGGVYYHTLQAAWACLLDAQKRAHAHGGTHGASEPSAVPVLKAVVHSQGSASGNGGASLSPLDSNLQSDTDLVLQAVGVLVASVSAPPALTLATSTGAATATVTVTAADAEAVAGPRPVALAESAEEELSTTPSVGREAAQSKLPAPAHVATYMIVAMALVVALVVIAMLLVRSAIRRKWAHSETPTPIGSGVGGGEDVAVATVDNPLATVACL